MKAHNATYPQLRDGAVSTVDRFHGLITTIVHDGEEVRTIGFRGPGHRFTSPNFNPGNVIHDEMVGVYHNP